MSLDTLHTDAEPTTPPTSMPPATHYLPNLIGLTGPAGSGKDSAADHLCWYHGYQRISFAEPLRLMVGAMLRYIDSPLMLSGDFARQDKERPIAELAALGPVTPRMLLQTLGTEWGRTISPQLWTVCAEAVMQRAARRGAKRFVITDVRFPEEWAWVHQLDGVIWQLHRPGVAPVRQHISETACAELDPDAVLFNTASLAELGTCIDTLLLDPSRKGA